MAPKKNAKPAPVPRKRATPASTVPEAKAQVNGTKTPTQDENKKTHRPGDEDHASAPVNKSNKRKRATPTVPEDRNGVPAPEEVETEPAPAKRAKPSSATRRGTAPKTRTPKIREKINKVPTAPLDIFVFGEGAGAELGLGSKTINGRGPTEVTRPRLNNLLSSNDVGVVQVTCGGMHAVGLTRDNRILTWGVNDLGALGRATDVEEDDDDELNPAESTPGPVDTSDLDPEIRWAQVAASDNASFALTDDGRVYGWGTFRVGSAPFGPSLRANLTLLSTPLVWRRYHGLHRRRTRSEDARPHPRSQEHHTASSW